MSIIEPLCRSFLGMNQRIGLSNAPRLLPALNDLNRPYWTGGAKGDLLILRCESCRRWQHPPLAACSACGSALVAEKVSGNGALFSYTVNYQPFHPDVAPPYVVAIVELAEQDDIRLPTNIVNCDPDTLHVGMPVRVLFEQHGDVFVPIFEPADIATM
jgi:uncharacterized OB-fold protein